MRTRMMILAAAVVLALSANAALSQPDPDESIWGPRVGRSPNNVGVAGGFEYQFRGRLIDAGGFDVPGFPPALVELRILAPCQNPVVLNPDAASDATGLVVWGPVPLNQGGGACAAAGVVEIWVDADDDGFAAGDLFAVRGQVTSPDENGDGLVALNDLVVWRTAFNAGAPLHRGDLNRDGMITIADLVFFRQHFLAGALRDGGDGAALAPAALDPAEAPSLENATWGTIKSAYR